MGLPIDREAFEPEEYRRFSKRLEECLEALRCLLNRPGFGTGPATIGAELELSLVDHAGQPLPCNEDVRAATADPRVTVELDRFNLECNLTPNLLAGRPFSAFARELDDLLCTVVHAVGAQGGRPALIGILPTLQASHLRADLITDQPRYRALNAALRRLRHNPFHIRIDGQDPLDLTSDDVSPEGANTSWQIHLRVEPSAFARVYNAVQMATAPVLAVAGNSPTFLGHRLWRETRIALFKQAVDERMPEQRDRRVARVAFGQDWVHEGVVELFEQSVRLHEPVLPILSDEPPLQVVNAGLVPQLDELRLHQSTIWRWNRPIFDASCGGHVRIEMRCLPSGPTVTDMLANGAFFVGLALDLAEEIADVAGVCPFDVVHDGFYRAAQGGLEARLCWPRDPDRDLADWRLEHHTAGELALRLLPNARRGLLAAGVETAEADSLLDVIKRRVVTRQTGAEWQCRTLAELEPALGRRRALHAMLRHYVERSLAGVPVHEWDVPTAAPASAYSS
jgi:hypothetical protein